MVGYARDVDVVDGVGVVVVVVVVMVVLWSVV